MLRLPRCVDGAIAVVRRGPGPPDCGRRLAGADHSYFLFLGGRLGSQIESASLARHPPRSWHPFAVSIARAVIIFPDPTRARTGVARMAGRRVLERGGAPTNRVADACAKRDASQICRSGPPRTIIRIPKRVRLTLVHYVTRNLLVDERSMRHYSSPRHPAHKHTHARTYTRTRARAHATTTTRPSLLPHTQSTCRRCVTERWIAVDSPLRLLPILRLIYALFRTDLCCVLYK